MFVRLLHYIKRHVSFLWPPIDWLNTLLFKWLHCRKFKRIVPEVIKEYGLTGFTFRKLEYRDLSAIKLLTDSQAPGRLDYFKPHGFEEKELYKVFKNPAFLMMGAFEGRRMVGYFFLRFFWNRRCFVGRLIDQQYEGKGIGRVMNKIMYQIGWQSGFRVLSTISRNNRLVMKAHAKNDSMVVLKELYDDFLLVEFKPIGISKNK